MNKKKSNPNSLKAEAPSVFRKSVKINFGEMLKALSEVVSGGADLANGNFAGGAEALSGFLNLAASFDVSDTAEVRLWKLLNRSIGKAISETTVEIIDTHAAYKKENKELLLKISRECEQATLVIDNKFWQNPRSLESLRNIEKTYYRWLLALGLREIDAHRTTDKLGTYYVYNLRNEWCARPDYYNAIYEKTNTPFAAAAQNEWEWERYNAYLEKQTLAPIFGKNYGIRDLYIPLAAYCSTQHRVKEVEKQIIKKVLHIFDLELHCKQWLQSATKENSILVVSGGPGSGKSSFSKIFSADIARRHLAKVLYFPLQNFPLNDRLIEAIGTYLRLSGDFSSNPMETINHSDSKKTLLIFDGLDELTKPGDTAENEARKFLTELRTTLAQINSRECKFISIVTGRTAIIQASREALRINDGMEFHLLKLHSNQQELAHEHADDHVDPNNLLHRDLRESWWKKYQSLAPEEPKEMPDIFYQDDVADITAEPLLIFLFAASEFHHKALESQQINRNSIYQELFKGVQERKYDSAPDSIKTKLKDEFEEVMEAIAMAAWYGDGRTATLEDVKAACSDRLLKSLNSIATTSGGMHRLIAAFYFKESEGRDRTSKAFEFTHKSFGEYLTARKIIREVKRIHNALRAEEDTFTNSEAIKRWAALTGKEPLSSEVLRFISDEIHLNNKERAKDWQETLSALLGYSLRTGLNGLGMSTFNAHRIAEYTRNSEETLLALIACCARISKQLHKLQCPKRFDAASFINRLHSLRNGIALSVTNESLCFMNLKDEAFHLADFFSANLSNSDLSGSLFHMSDLRESLFIDANLEHAEMFRCSIDGANFAGSNLRNCTISYCSTTNINWGMTINFRGSDAQGASFCYSSLIGADFSGADLSDADFTGAELYAANFIGATLNNTKFTNAIVNPSSFDEGVRNIVLFDAIRTDEIIPDKYNVIDE